MRIKRAIAVVGLCLSSLFVSAWAEEPTGAAFCVTCHDEEDLPDMRASPHLPGVKKPPPMAAAAAALSRRAMGDSENPRTPDCISCHGESKEHAYKPAGAKDLPKPDRTFGKTPGKLSKFSAVERSAVCQTCHDRDPKRALWGGSQHQTADIACDSCHQVHTNRDKVLKKATQTEVCYTCHKEQRAQMERVSHHPVPEGKMTCSDCHNVHGSAGPKLAKRDSTNDTCYTCHAEKRGPFVHQHEPVAEDCSNCHNSHGSSVPGLLKARAPMLCQQCHTPHVSGGVAALGGQRGVYGLAVPGQISPLITNMSNGKNAVNLWQGRSCMNCHTQVHGSNNPSATNPTPQLMLR
jgi:DmsE family decaheme c-type cytochrome